MSTVEPNYTTETEPYAERHYIKVFAKKYSSAWDVTYSALKETIARIDTAIASTDRAVIIHAKDGFKIVKVYFRVAGTRDSALSSGNRCIVLVDESQHLCKILLVYSKNEIGPPNETQKWEKVLSGNYPDTWRLFQ